MMLFLIGFVSFLLAGFGLGGGVLLIPLLTAFQGVGHREAAYMCLIAYIPAAIGVIIKNRPPVKAMLKYIIIGMAGAVIGAVISGMVPVELLKKFYGIFLVVFGLQMVIKTAVSSLKKSG